MLLIAHLAGDLNLCAKKYAVRNAAGMPRWTHCLRAVGQIEAQLGPCIQTLGRAEGHRVTMEGARSSVVFYYDRTTQGFRAARARLDAVASKGGGAQRKSARPTVRSNERLDASR